MLCNKCATKINSKHCKRDLYRNVHKAVPWKDEHFNAKHTLCIAVFCDNLIQKMRYCRQVMLVAHALISIHRNAKIKHTRHTRDWFAAFRKRKIDDLKCFICPYNASIDGPRLFPIRNEHLVLSCCVCVFLTLLCHHIVFGASIRITPHQPLACQHSWWQTCAPVCMLFC